MATYFHKTTYSKQLIYTKVEKEIVINKLKNNLLRPLFKKQQIQHNLFIQNNLLRSLFKK